MSHQDQLRALIKHHCVTLITEADAIGTHIRQLEDASIDGSEAISNAIAMAHKIKGSSGSIGFAAISSAAGSLESYLSALASTGMDPTAAQINTVAGLFDELNTLVRTVSPESSTLYNAGIPGLTDRVTAS
ncbi:MAG: Hpt domain-containing protein [Rhizobiaceae bacterium]|nr:Hpt domain-containing protein [Rhizobiaceae bacterium]